MVAAMMHARELTIALAVSATLAVPALAEDLDCRPFFPTTAVRCRFVASLSFGFSACLSSAFLLIFSACFEFFLVLVVLGAHVSAFFSL